MQDSNKLAGSFCRQLATYLADYADMSITLLRSCNWKSKETVECN